MEYAYSDNEELFQGRAPTLAEALEAALDDYPDDESVWIGEATQKTIGGYFGQYAAEQVLEQLAQAAGDDCGEAAEDWLEGPICPRRMTQEPREDHAVRIEKYKIEKAEWIDPLVALIRAALENWATENDEQPGFYHVGNAQQYTREEAQAIIDAEPPCPKAT